MFDFINVPLGWVLRFIADIFNNNFAIAVFVFTLLVNIIFIPLTIKSQKSSVQQLRLKPKIDEIKNKYGDDKQKVSQETSKLYQEEKVSMSGGCLPMIFRLIIMMSIYTLIMSPLTYMANVEKAPIDNVKTAITTVINDELEQTKTETEKANKGKSDKEKVDVDDAVKERQAKLNEIIKWDVSRQNELDLVKVIRLKDDAGNSTAVQKIEELYKECGVKLDPKIKTDIEKIIEKDNETNINYYFFTKNIDLTDTPDFDWNIFDAFRLNWILPIIAFLAQILSSILSMKMQKKTNPDAPSMSGMLLMMPVISLFIGFSLPCGVTFYWACSSLIGGLLQVAVQYYYGPHKLLAKMRGKELTKQCDFEAGQISKISTDE